MSADLIFDGSFTFTDEQGRALAANLSAQNLEELLQAEEGVDPEVYLIK